MSPLAPGTGIWSSQFARRSRPLLYKFGISGALRIFGRPRWQDHGLGRGGIRLGRGEATAGPTVRTWQAAVGVEAIASLHSDTIVLDIAPLRAEVLDPMIYAFANGHGRSRGNVRQFEADECWRVMGLSSGEVSCATWLRTAGFTVGSGQADARNLISPVQGRVRRIRFTCMAGNPQEISSTRSIEAR
jgi:hypothetical protein